MTDKTVGDQIEPETNARERTRRPPSVRRALAVTSVPVAIALGVAGIAFSGSASAEGGGKEVDPANVSAPQCPDRGRTGGRGVDVDDGTGHVLGEESPGDRRAEKPRRTGDGRGKPGDRDRDRDRSGHQSEAAGSGREADGKEEVRTRAGRGGTGPAGEDADRSPRMGRAHADDPDRSTRAGADPSSTVGDLGDASTDLPVCSDVTTVGSGGGLTGTEPRGGQDVDGGTATGTEPDHNGSEPGTEPDHNGSQPGTEPDHDGSRPGQPEPDRDSDQGVAAEHGGDGGNGDGERVCDEMTAAAE